MVDCYDRYLIRYSRNARKCTQLFGNVLSKIPAGIIKTDNNKFTPPSKSIDEISYGKFNSIILSIFTEGFHINKGGLLYCL